MPRYITHTLVTIFLLVFPARLYAITWSEAQFTVNAGTVVARQDGLTLSPNEQGQILVSVPASGLTLTDEQRVTFKFTGAPPPRIYVLWQRSDSTELFQHGFAAGTLSEPFTDMRGVRGWEGQARTLELGFLVHLGTQVTLQSAAVDTPGIGERLQETLQGWLHFRPWLPIDINLYSGARELMEGPYPVPRFTLLALVLIFLYLLLRRSRARWNEVALIVFTVWLLLDLLWQWRLWHQVGATRDRFAGISSAEKLLAKDDAVIARLAAQASSLVDTPSARVFIASQSDGNGMRAAYHMAPLNTFWHRHGAELPDRRYLRAGDYILVLGPTTIRYNREAGRIRLPSGEDLAVTELDATGQSVFLEVAR